ncbi:hypothetical protein JCM8202_005633 [Rhodotorula sphaerocarpa]
MSTGPVFRSDAGPSQPRQRVSDEAGAHGAPRQDIRQPTSDDPALPNAVAIMSLTEPDAGSSTAPPSEPKEDTRHARRSSGQHRRRSSAAAQIPRSQSSDLYAPARNVFPLVQRKAPTPSGSHDPSPGVAPDAALPSPLVPSTSAPNSPAPSSEPRQTASGSPSLAGTEIESRALARSQSSAAGSSHRRESIASSPVTSRGAASSEFGPASPSPRRKFIVRPTYTSSLAPTSAQQYQASQQPSSGPSGSIFQNPTPTSRSLSELVPKKKLSSFSPFGRRKAREEAGRVPPPGGGGSASVLDAALAASATWATRRGEVGAGPAPSMAGSSRPASRVATSPTPSRPLTTIAFMGNVPDNPVNERSIAEAFSRGGGKARALPEGDETPVPGSAPGGRAGSAGSSSRNEIGRIDEEAVGDPGGKSFLAPGRTALVFPTRKKPPATSTAEVVESPSKGKETQPGP